MNAAILVWALWIDPGMTGQGLVNSDNRPYIAAYFETAEECNRVNNMIKQQRFKADSAWSQCIQAKYIIQTK